MYTIERNDQIHLDQLKISLNRLRRYLIYSHSTVRICEIHPKSRMSLHKESSLLLINFFGLENSFLKKSGRPLKSLMPI